jgi:hypothetical protein
LKEGGNSWRSGNIKFEGRRKQLEKSKYKVEGGNRGEKI